MYFLGAAELLIVEDLILTSRFSPGASIYVCFWRLFCTVACLLGACVLYVVGLKMYYFYGKSIGGTLFVCCMEVVRISESPLWEVPL